MTARPRSGPYQLFMVALSFYVLAALLAQTVFRLHPDTLQILDITDIGICMIFLIDFLVCIVRAERPLRYLFTWGWLDLIASVPTIDWFRWGRAARAYRILRVLRGLRATRVLSSFALQRRAESALWASAFFAILLIIFGSIAMLHLERAAEGSITTPSDALWWSIVSVTTVGYGDTYPVTPAGRVLAVFLMVAGIGLFGTFTAYVASAFLQPEEEDIQRELSELKQEVKALRGLLETRAAAPPQDDPVT